MKNREKRCHMCEAAIEDLGIISKDSLIIDKTWGYFSEKDGERHIIRLCETCYDSWIKSLKIPPHVERENIYL